MKCYLCVSNPINFASISSDINISINALNLCQFNRQLTKSRHQIRDLLYPVAVSIFWSLRRKNIIFLIFSYWFWNNWSMFHMFLTRNILLILEIVYVLPQEIIHDWKLLLIFYTCCIRMLFFFSKCIKSSKTKGKRLIM